MRSSIRSLITRKMSVVWKLPRSSTMTRVFSHYVPHSAGPILQTSRGRLSKGHVIIAANLVRDSSFVRTLGRMAGLRRVALPSTSEDRGRMARRPVPLRKSERVILT